MNKEEKILQLKQTLYLNFNNFNDNEIKEVAVQLVKLVTNSNKDIKNKFKPCLMDAYKFLSEVEYLSKEYRESLSYLIKIENIDLYKRETTSTVNHVKVRKFQCESMIGIYENNFKKIKLLISELIDFGENNVQELQQTLRDDYDKIYELVNSYLNNSIKTIINFKLPYKIAISEDEEISYKLNDTTFNLKFKNIVDSDNSLIPFEAYNGILEMEYDKYGVSSYSELTLTFDKFYHATHDMGGLINYCSQSFNYFLDYYRQITGYYWIDNLNLTHIHKSNVKVISENYDDIISIPFYYGQILKFQRHQLL